MAKRRTPYMSNAGEEAAPAARPDHTDDDLSANPNGEEVTDATDSPDMLSPDPGGPQDPGTDSAKQDQADQDQTQETEP